MWAGVWVWARAARVPGQGTSFPTSSTGGGRAQCSVQPQLPAERDCCWPAELAQLGRNGTAQRSTSGAEQASQQERRGGGGQRARHCCPPLPKAKKRTSRTSERHWQPPAGGTALTHTQKRKRADSRPRAHTRRKGKNKRKKGKKGGQRADSRPRRPRRAPGLGDNVVVGVQRLHHPAPREQAQPLRLAHLHQVLRGGEPGVGRGWEVNPCIRVLRSCICTRFCRGPRIGVGRQTPKGGEMCAGAPNLYISGNSCADKLH